jgi:beta-glucanase (GH16 family)
LMNLYLHSADGKALVAAPIARIPGAGGGGGILYGRYAMRFRADPVPGYKTAWLLWPDTDHWADGEIDFPEGNLTGSMMAAMHHTGDPERSTNYGTNAGYGSWHTAVLEWTAQSVTFTLDGRTLGHFTDASLIPTTPMHWVLQTETTLSGPAPSPSAAGNVQIDWVAAWAQA